jgi:hypothetical protein
MQIRSTLPDSLPSLPQEGLFRRRDRPLRRPCPNVSQPIHAATLDWHDRKRSDDNRKPRGLDSTAVGTLGP